jgi:hypothetical protein
MILLEMPAPNGTTQVRLRWRGRRLCYMDGAELTPEAFREMRTNGALIRAKNQARIRKALGMTAREPGVTRFKYEGER